MLDDKIIIQVCKFGFLIFAFTLINCIGFGEPKIITAYRFYNDSNDTVELISQGIESNKINDSLIYEYFKNYCIDNYGYREIIEPHKYKDIQSIERWLYYIQENKISLVVLNTDSVNSIKSFDQGLINKCVEKIIPLKSDSLDDVDYEIHFK